MQKQNKKNSKHIFPYIVNVRTTTLFGLSSPTFDEDVTFSIIQGAPFSV